MPPPQTLLLFFFSFTGICDVPVHVIINMNEILLGSFHQQVKGETDFSYF